MSEKLRDERYKYLFENSLCGMIVADILPDFSFKICKFNKKAKTFLGIDEEICEILKLSDFMDQSNLNFAYQIISKLKDAGDEESFILQLYNGVIEGNMYLESTYEENRYVYVQFLPKGENIAIRRREASQREVLESILNSIHCGVIRYTYIGDEEHVILVNKTAWSMLGYSDKEDCVNQGFEGILARVNPEDQKNLLKTKYMLNGDFDKKQCEFRLLKEGKESWISAQFQLFRDSQNKSVVQLTLMDISAEKELERKKEAENSEIIQSLGAIYSLILYIDIKNDSYRVIKHEGDAILLNPGSYTRDLERMSILFRSDDNVKATEALSLEALSRLYSEQKNLCDATFFIEDGNRRYYQVETVMMGANGQLERVTMGIRNVTEARERQIQEKEAMQSAYKAATKANAAKSDFLSSMSHDIRTPLNAIVGLSHLMEMNMDDKKQIGECIKEIEQASQLLLRLINDILDVSRIESGKMEISSDSFSLVQLIDNLKTIIMQQMRDHGHTFNVELDDIDGLYIGDELNIQKILTNLLSNAIKFTPDGGEILLKVWAEDVSKGNSQQIHFIVKDNGVGMAPEFINRIFQPFEREVDRLDNRIQGTGLGMSIVNNLVNLMNGWIEVKSEVNEGSEFHIMLPLKHTQQCNDNKTLQPAAASKAVKPDLKNCRILVVEDNAINRKIAVKLIEDLGATVETAENGKEGLRLYEESQDYWYDLIFMDVRMPIMDGYEATKQIRRSNRADNCIPIVAMTANAFAEDVHNALQAGMNMHLSKPIQIDKLYEVLHDQFNL